MIDSYQFHQLVRAQVESAGMRLVGLPRLTKTGRVVADVDALPSRTILEQSGMIAWGRELRQDGIGLYVAFEVKIS